MCHPFMPLHRHLKMCIFRVPDKGTLEKEKKERETNKRRKQANTENVQKQEKTRKKAATMRKQDQKYKYWMKEDARCVEWKNRPWNMSLRS